MRQCGFGWSCTKFTKLYDANEIDSRVLSKIIENPAILGVGNVRVIDPVEGYLGSGNTYLLLSDFDQKRCYAVLVKRRCNNTEDLHRVIKFSNLMRMRVPSHEHCADLVAEEFNADLIDRAATLCGIIPIAVIKMEVCKQSDSLSIVCNTLIREECM